MFDLDKVEEIISTQFNDHYDENNNIIKFSFNDKSLVQRAFTHSSFSEYSYERLEFLGDSILGAVVSDYLFSNYKHLEPGTLTLIRKNIVDKPPLVKIIKNLGLNKFAILGKGEQLNHFEQTNKFCGDLYESIVGAIFTDQGYEKAKEFILFNLMDTIVEVSSNPEKYDDFKSKLNDYCQKHNHTKEFVLVESKGEIHKPIHVVNLLIDGKVVSSAAASKVSEAEQTCARIFLVNLKSKNNK